jgi:hypothetical protein
MESISRTIMLTIFVSGVLISSCSTSHSGNVFEDLWSDFNDPIGIQRASKDIFDGVERTLMQLNTLETRVNYDAAQRISQIRAILADADRSIDKVKEDVLAIEKQVNGDAINLIYRAECAAPIAVLQFRQGFSDLVSDLIKTNPALKVAGLNIVDLSLNKIEITDPDKAYWDLKKKRL